MGVILQCHAKFRTESGEIVTVPAPVDPATPDAPWFYDHIASQANDFAKAGFTALLLMPVIKTQSGDTPTADGYGPYDDYDIGSKDQMGSFACRGGTRFQLQRLAAIMRANGLDLYLDMVLHQRMGGDKFVYRYLGADGVPNAGAFPKNPDCFFPNVPRDPIAGPVGDDFGFGDELCPINAKPHDYVALGLIHACDWVTRALDARGYRIDDTKGLSAGFLHRYLTSRAMAGKFAVGEYFDGNPDTLEWWIWNSGMQGRANTFDFGIRFTLAAMCNNTSRWDMRQLIYPNLIARDAAHAVSFVENHDTDLSFPVIWNKILGYAFLLTREGYPCVYYKDYSTDAGCYGLKPYIDNLVWIHEMFANGETAIRAAEYQYIIYERLGYEGLPGCLVGLNNDMYSGWMPITVQTSFGPHTQLHDYTGNSNDVWTDQYGNAEIWLPPNNNGRGYVVFAKAGQEREIEPVMQTTTQVFQGRADLDIDGARADEWTGITAVYVRGGSKFEVKIEQGAEYLDYEIGDPANNEVVTQADELGEYTLHVIRNPVADIADSVPLPFTLSLTYQAPQTLPGNAPVTVQDGQSVAKDELVLRGAAAVQLEVRAKKLAGAQG